MMLGTNDINEKCKNIDGESAAENTTPKYDLPKFRCQKVLQNNISKKTIALLGTFPETNETDTAVVLLEKQAFYEKDVKRDSEESEENATFFSDKTSARLDLANNIYASFICSVNSDLNAVKATVIYPATSKHLEKYSASQKSLINETPERYKNITLPYIEDSQFSLQWVYNILEHKQESERILYEDTNPETGFVLLPDLKWNGTNIDGLYVLAIVQKRNIKSIRDLTGEHLPLLRNIQSSTAKLVDEKYGIKREQLRMYLHYQPSFYHLHVHINQLRTDMPGIWCEKSHLLETVINNLELMSDYYQKATIPFVLAESMELLRIYKDDTAAKQKCLKHKSTDEDDLVDSVVVSKIPRTDDQAVQCV